MRRRPTVEAGSQGVCRRCAEARKPGKGFFEVKAEAVWLWALGTSSSGKGRQPLTLLRGCLHGSTGTPRVWLRQFPRKKEE